MTMVSKGKFLIFLCLIALLAIFASAALAQGNGAERKIVVFADNYVNEHAQAGLLRAFGGEPLRPLGLVNGMAVLLPPAAENMLAKRAEVLSIEIDAEIHAAGKPPWAIKPPPEQPAQELPWGVDRIDAEWAWGVSTGTGIKVAVMDTGIDADHPDLAANIAGGINYTSRNPRKPADPNNWDDDNGHGTHVSGTIAAIDNDSGVVGVAPDASLYAVKVLDKNGSGYVSDLILGLQWVIDNDMDVVNMSLSTSADVTALHTACDAADSAGVLLVAAAGNSGGSVEFPAAYSSVIAVAATDSADNRASWSNYGSQVDIAAPGVNVKSTWKGGAYDTISGTSMATPHVAGTLALNLSANLAATADDLPPSGVDIYTGWGLVDAEEAATGSEASGDD